MNLLLKAKQRIVQPREGVNKDTGESNTKDTLDVEKVWIGTTKEGAEHNNFVYKYFNKWHQMIKARLWCRITFGRKVTKMI